MLEHLRQDAPQALIVVGTGIGAAVGGMVGKTASHAVVGAGIGFLISAFIHAATGDR